MKKRLILIGLFAGGLAVALGILTQPGVRPNPYPLPISADPENLDRLVHSLVEALPPRSHQPRDADATARFIHAELSRYGQPRFEPYSIHDLRFQNVVVRIDADRPEGESRAPLVVGAHYDVFNALPGADDNASGVAGLIEMARLFAAQPAPFPVILAAYSTEEPPYYGGPHMGSYRHASRLVEQGIKPRLMISLDMIGYFTDEPASQGYPVPGFGALYGEVGDFIAIIGRVPEALVVRQIKSAFYGRGELAVRSLTMPPILPAMSFSDHSNFWQFGIPAVLITDTAFMRNPHYHRTSDIPDTLDYRRMAFVVNGLFDAIQNLH